MGLTYVPICHLRMRRLATAAAVAAPHGPRSMDPMNGSGHHRQSSSRRSRRRVLQGGGLALAAGVAQACDAWSVVGKADDRYPGGSPFAIEALRARDFRAGDIRLHRTLNQRPSYTTYTMTYRSDDLLLTGVATIPKSAGPHPVVVLNHGFMLPVQYDSGDGTRAMAAELSPRGFITLASDYRGHGGSEDDTRLNSGARLEFAIDVLNLVASIPSLPDAQHERVGMWGHSLGCDLALRAAEVDARVQPVGMWAPLSAWAEDLVDYYRLPTLSSSKDLRHALSPGELSELSRRTGDDPSGRGRSCRQASVGGTAARGAERGGGGERVDDSSRRGALPDPERSAGGDRNGGLLRARAPGGRAMSGKVPGWHFRMDGGYAGSGKAR